MEIWKKILHKISLSHFATDSTNTLAVVFDIKFPYSIVNEHLLKWQKSDTDSWS